MLVCLYNGEDDEVCACVPARTYLAAFTRGSSAVLDTLRLLLLRGDEETEGERALCAAAAVDEADDEEEEKREEGTDATSFVARPASAFSTSHACTDCVQKSGHHVHPVTPLPADTANSKQLCTS